MKNSPQLYINTTTILAMLLLSLQLSSRESRWSDYCQYRFLSALNLSPSVLKAPSSAPRTVLTTANVVIWKSGLSIVDFESSQQTAIRKAQKSSTTLMWIDNTQNIHINKNKPLLRGKILGSTSFEWVAPNAKPGLRAFNPICITSVPNSVNKNSPRPTLNQTGPECAPP